MVVALRIYRWQPNGVNLGWADVSYFIAGLFDLAPRRCN